MKLNIFFRVSEQSMARFGACLSLSLLITICAESRLRGRATAIRSSYEDVACFDEKNPGRNDRVSNFDHPS